MREQQPPTPAPDRVTFDPTDYVLPLLGLCAVCLAAAGSAHNAVRVGTLNRGTARDVERCRIVTPLGRSMIWTPGAEIVPDPEWLAELARLFGPAASFTEGAGHPLPLFAVTTVDGTMMCGRHATYVKAAPAL